MNSFSNSALKKEMMTNVFLYGRSGTGKTILGAEITKIKLSQMIESKRDVRVIVTMYDAFSQNGLLLQNLREKYFKNIDSQVLPFSELSRDLNIEGDMDQPKDMINKVTGKLSQMKENIILFVDELSACHYEGQTTPDWSDVTTADNVVWILSVRPSSTSNEMINLSPPVSDKVLSTKLVRGHRNCLEIRSVVISSFYISYQLQNRQFSTWYVSHFYKEQYISLEDDVPVEGDELPQGSTPIWIDVPPDTTHLEILKEVEQLTSSRSVTVLYCDYDDERDTGAEDYCHQKNWDYRDLTEMIGCEDEVIIAIDYLQPETITRPHNLLVMVTTPGSGSGSGSGGWLSYFKDTVCLKSALNHKHRDHKCEKTSDCSYSGKTLLEKRRFPEVTEIDEEFDPFHVTVSPKRKKEYDDRFNSLEPQAGLLSEEKVRNYLEKYLPVSSVDKIWSLSDQDGDGCLDRYEWTVADHFYHRVLIYDNPIPDQVVISLIS